jgi:hypothetical protein
VWLYVVATFLFTLGSDWVNLINEDDGRGIFLGLFEHFSEVTLTLTSHLAHNFRTINEEKEDTSFIHNCSSHEHLSSTRGAKQEKASWQLDTDRFEQLWMMQGKLDKLSDLCHLFVAATNIIIVNINEIGFLIFTLDGVTLWGLVSDA